MKKFRFSLGKVLRFHQQTLDAKLGEMTLLQSQLREIDSEIAQLGRRYDETNRRLVEQMQIGLTPGEIQSVKTFLNALTEKIRRLQQRRAHMLELIAIKQQEILKVKTEIAGLEKLHDKQLAAYNEAVRKSEEQAIEEFAAHARS